MSARSATRGAPEPTVATTPVRATRKLRRGEGVRRELREAGFGFCE
jgi:hypothetical protein